MTNEDIINTDEFQKALAECINRAVDRCIEVDCDYDETFLENKWSRRLLDYWHKDATAQTIIPIMEQKFSF